MTLIEARIRFWLTVYHLFGAVSDWAHRRAVGCTARAERLLERAREELNGSP